MSERVVVGMSGGVDSSVAAALLVEQGFDVVGVTLHLAGSDSRCCSLDDADDARRVADRLGIRFYVANYKDRFRDEVILPFADAYLAGETPIPCVACNKRFKFDHLMARAQALGADSVATGHYARVEADPESGTRRLLRAVDSRKDQSYFLFNLDQSQLARTRFPLGSLTKNEVRDRARALGLVTAEKPESQEICFVPDGDYAAVVERLRPESVPGEGQVVDESGRVLGSHGGIHRFTVGQRRGLGLSGPEPLYVKSLEPEHNRVVVAPKLALERAVIEVRQVSWTAPEPLVDAFPARVRVRYRDSGAPATVEPGPAGSARVVFDEPVASAAPGQAAVFDRDGEVVGGGWIARSDSTSAEPRG